MALAACQEKGGYTINGTIADAKDGDYVYMRYYDGRESFTLDSAVVKNGKFEFKGMPDSVFAPKYITYGSGANSLVSMVMLILPTIKLPEHLQMMHLQHIMINILCLITSWEIFREYTVQIQHLQMFKEIH